MGRDNGLGFRISGLGVKAEEPGSRNRNRDRYRDRFDCDNVFLEYCFLRERLQPLQRLAVAIAAAGVLISLIGYGEMPWLALLMALFLGLCGLIRKQVDNDSVTGLTIEVLLLTPIAVVMYLRGKTVFLDAGLSIDLLLIGSGIVSILLLLFFVVAARRLKLATAGLMQYIAPTCHLMIGVFMYGEHFTAPSAAYGQAWPFKPPICGVSITNSAR